jgi:hypothetical protein
MSRSASAPVVIDARQLVRIESVHRGFLYQHLFAVACLLMAGPAQVLGVVVEADEDIELVLAGRRLYLQVKYRKERLAPADVADALTRFEAIRAEHAPGQRDGEARFAIVSNARPSESLAAMRAAKDWPADVALIWPDGVAQIDPAIPRPPRDLFEAAALCTGLAGALEFGLLRPETLTWKLASLVMLASAGGAPRQDHRFSREELPDLFEQLVVQMQELPAPPLHYRAQMDEPPLLTGDRVRILAGLSGAGKTAWVAEAVVHSATPVTYLDVVETPGAALASAVAREVAARMFGRRGSRLGEVLFTGASGLDTLGALSVKLGEEGLQAHVVIDNAHRVPAADLRSIVDRARHLSFLLICQPSAETPVLEASLDVGAETLSGWDEDTIAAAASDAGCRADYADCERLSRLTGGLPFYVLNAATVAAREYSGSIAAFCADIEGQTHIVEVAQEIILRRAFEGLPPAQRETVALLSLADVALSRDEASAFLQGALGIDARAAAQRVRDLPASGALELFGNAGVKIHDAVRLLGRSDVAARGAEFERDARRSLRGVMVQSIRSDWSVAKLSLLIRLFGQLGEAQILVQFATDELFHEMGVWPEIEPFLIAAAADEEVDADTRLWALDGLVFNDLREGDVEAAAPRIAAMRALLGEHELDNDAWMAWGMKGMLLMSATDDPTGVVEMLDEVEARLPDSSEHRRVFRYNRALALFKLGQLQVAAEEAVQLTGEYYGELGLTPADVMGRNAPELQALLPKPRGELTDTLKHLADTLDLQAQALGALGQRTPLQRIHAMKFYELARAPQSMVRVGQDLVDEFVGMHDFTGARQLLETNILPMIQAMGLVSWTLPVRGQYAVVLAYDGAHDAADAEVERLLPYQEAMDPNHRAEFQNQRRMIANLRRFGGPPQRQVEIPADLQVLFDRRRGQRQLPARRVKIGRNEKCPCGSERKYKHCHGR